MDTRVKFLDLEFENPILPASGPITEGLDNLINLSKSSLGGLVTKTISIKGAEVKSLVLCLTMALYTIQNYGVSMIWIIGSLF